MCLHVQTISKKKKKGKVKFEGKFTSVNNFGDAQKNQNMLPLKKNYLISFGNSNLNLATTPYEHKIKSY